LSVVPKRRTRKKRILKMGRSSFVLFLFVPEILAQTNVWSVPATPNDKPPVQYFAVGEIKIRCLAAGVDESWKNSCGAVISDVMAGWEDPDHKALKEDAWVVAVFPGTDGYYSFDFWAGAPAGSSRMGLLFAKHYKATIKSNPEKPELVGIDIYEALNYAYNELKSSIPKTPWPTRPIVPSHPSRDGTIKADASPPPRPFGASAAGRPPSPIPKGSDLAAFCLYH
jgi:hypothetical protein